MGMRCDQFFGLTEAAQKLLFEDGHQLVKTYRANGEFISERLRPCQVDCGIRERCGSYRGMFGDKYPLWKYTMPNGSVLYEDVQSEFWSSGPCFFLALRNEAGDWVKKSLWPQEEIDRA